MGQVLLRAFLFLDCIHSNLLQIMILYDMFLMCRHTHTHIQIKRYKTKTIHTNRHSEKAKARRTILHNSMQTWDSRIFAGKYGILPLHGFQHLFAKQKFCEVMKLYFYELHENMAHRLQFECRDQTGQRGANARTQ